MVEEDKDHMEGEEDDQDPEKNEDDQYPNTDAKLRESVRTTFQMFDKENQGFIDIASLEKLLQFLNYNPTRSEIEEYRGIYDQGQKNQITADQVMTIANEKAGEPDTIEEFVEAAKVFDHDNDGKIEIAELRYAMSRLGDPLDESEVDDLIGELDKEKTGLIDILDWAKITFK